MKPSVFAIYLSIGFLFCSLAVAQRLPPGSRHSTEKTDSSVPFRLEKPQILPIGDVDAFGVGSSDNSDGMIEGQNDIGSEETGDAPPVQRKVVRKEQSHETHVVAHPKKVSKSKSKKIKTAKVSQKKKAAAKSKNKKISSKKQQQTSKQLVKLKKEHKDTKKKTNS